jgi:hypothetical protein
MRVARGAVRPAAALAAFAGVTLAGAAARAQDAFEIQVYDSDTAARLEPGIEVHLNTAAETHATFEPHLGLTDWLELGGYFQTAVSSERGLDYAGVKLRLKARLPQKLWHDRVGLALNGELSTVPARYEPNMWGSELRPIVDVTAGVLYASFNPIVTVDLAGDLAGRPQLEPAAKLALRATERMSLGIEAYTALGPIDDLGSEHVERLLLCWDWAGAVIDLNARTAPFVKAVERPARRSTLGSRRCSNSVFRIRAEGGLLSSRDGHAVHRPGRVISERCFMRHGRRDLSRMS